MRRDSEDRAVAVDCIAWFVHWESRAEPRRAVMDEVEDLSKPSASSIDNPRRKANRINHANENLSQKLVLLRTELASPDRPTDGLTERCCAAARFSRAKALDSC